MVPDRQVGLSLSGWTTVCVSLPVKVSVLYWSDAYRLKHSSCQIAYNRRLYCIEVAPIVQNIPVVKQHTIAVETCVASSVLYWYCEQALIDENCLCLDSFRFLESVLPATCHLSESTSVLRLAVFIFADYQSRWITYTSIFVFTDHHPCQVGQRWFPGEHRLVAQVLHPLQAVWGAAVQAGPLWLRPTQHPVRAAYSRYGEEKVPEWQREHNGHACPPRHEPIQTGMRWCAALLFAVWSFGHKPFF